MDDIRVFVSNRIDLKNRYQIKDSIYTPVRCNAINDSSSNNMLGDDSGDNISADAKYFAELSVQYWAWKNIKADYYGLCHYRRFLDILDKDLYELNEYGIYEAPILCKPTVDKLGLNEKELLEQEIRKYDAVINKPCDVDKFITTSRRKNKNVKELWLHSGFITEEYFEVVLLEIERVAPDYREIAEKYLLQRYHYGYNCYVMKKELFDELNKFEFSVIKGVKEYAINKKDPLLENRLLGYIMEFLYGIYVYGLLNEGVLRIKQVPLVIFMSHEDIEISAFNVKIMEMKQRCWIKMRKFIKVLSNILFPGGTKRRLFMRKIYHLFWDY